MGYKREWAVGRTARRGLRGPPGYPCAVGIAAPPAIVRGAGEAADQGIIMRTGEAFQTFRTVTQVLLDKTGALT